jgi:hypothetical protein
VDAAEGEVADLPHLHSAGVDREDRMGDSTGRGRRRGRLFEGRERGVAFAGVILEVSMSLS